MSYVIQLPHSLTNPSDNYRVIEYTDWVDYTKGEKQAIVPAAEFRHYEDALARRDELNDA